MWELLFGRNEIGAGRRLSFPATVPWSVGMLEEASVSVSRLLYGCCHWNSNSGTELTIQDYDCRFGFKGERSKSKSKIKSNNKHQQQNRRRNNQKRRAKNILKGRTEERRQVQRQTDSFGFCKKIISSSKQNIIVIASRSEGRRGEKSNTRIF